ncbi:dTDP-4-dehydrorhamnose reductase [Draconibacterium sp. IB214405]|uniref:dTDP-4-dehydrorhamnose reductase n=1 Tax=Draconibacterium sp. IB214405 TaxID=3097352 RepID=UPI002A0F6307|nr:dTDP-4-dehydrorhamnose reductase [Draconibacterium sp. IB214405]MDX8339171.1 dTDP-4-dehydrorhamnose reductase [Draconibacterium sp. IB214405]
MKILITGAYGQLGSELKVLSKNYPGWEFVFTDVDSLDITDEDQVKSYFANNNFELVINCAAYTAVDKAESDFETAQKVNALAPKLLAKYSKEVGAKYIHVSTDYVFAGDAHLPYEEIDAVAPNGAYGKTKLEGEQNCQAENPETVIIRTAWLYSAFGNNFVKTMLRLGKERDELGVVFDQVGSPTYAADLASAILQVAESEKFVPGIYHYSNEGVASWFDFAKAIFELSGVKCKVKPVLSENFPTPAKRPAYSVLNKSKIRDTFDLKIPYWRDSLKICIKQLEKE